MIVIGFQGIGKSSISYKYFHTIIDLESSCTKVDGKRNDDWAQVYCQFAEDISRQGFIVLVSSHKAVQDILSVSREKVVTIFPSLSLRDEWVERLRVRYETTGKEKDLAAWKDSEQNYEKEITVLMNSPFKKVELKNMDYDLMNKIIAVHEDFI